MKNPALKPIVFSRQDVALMLRVAVFFGGATFAAQVGEPDEDVIELCADLIAKGCCEPGPAILDRLSLSRVPQGYAWNPK